MGTLKAGDILKGLDDDTASKPESKTKNNVRDIGAAKVSPYESELRQKLRAKTQFSFGQVPSFIVDIFNAQAEDRGMNRREYLYHLLREQGGDIPPYAEMDGRKL